MKKSVEIIAELGANHAGDLTKAAIMVQAAAEAGATTVKFQWVIASEILHPNAGLVPLPGGVVALYKRFKELERPASFYAELKRMVEAQGLKFLCTPFGLTSAAGLHNLNVFGYKIASPELNHYPLIRSCALQNRPLYLSLGVSTLADIELALTMLLQREQGTLLHCVTAYPAQPSDYNLRQIPALKTLLGVQVGVSDHTMDAVLVPTLAVLLGATVVEKHLCLSRLDAGLDDPIALEPNDFACMVQSIQLAQVNPELAWQSLEKQFGQEMIEATLGTGIKELAHSEMANYGRTNRSICVTDNLSAGTVLDVTNTALLRVEKELRPGLHPQYYEVALGRRLRHDLTGGQGITWNDI
jgi:sialic acid synthase SpsE